MIISQSVNHSHRPSNMTLSLTFLWNRNPFRLANWTNSLVFVDLILVTQKRLFTCRLELDSPETCRTGKTKR